jgi:hypothetical protein
LTKELLLLRGEITLVDAEDYEYLSQWGWYKDGTGYASMSITEDGKQRIYFLHRVIMVRVCDITGKVIDHINGDRLDNRKENLRAVSNAENLQNVHNKRKGCSSKYFGVWYDKGRQNWYAHIMKNYRKYYIGRFDTELEAAIAYNKKAEELGVLTRNIINEGEVNESY